MAGSFTLDALPAQLTQPATLILCWWYTAPDSGAGADAQGTYELIPNVVCERIDTRAGADPPVARFRYLMSQIYASVAGWPSRIEDVFPLAATGDYVVAADDRIVVTATNPDGSIEVLFDGFAQVPQVDASASAERASFVAIGVAARCNDQPINSRVQRDADTPDDTSGDSDVTIYGVCRFNPSGTRSNGTVGILGNATPSPLYTIPQGDPTGFPVFTEPLLEERGLAEDTVLVEEWYIGDALLYLLAQDNPGDPYITWPDPASIQTLVETLLPDASGILNVATAQTADSVIRDYDCTGKALPRVLEDLLAYAGFYYAWQTSADANNNPETFMRTFRVDAAASGSPKKLLLQPYGAPTLDPLENNVNQIHLARDVAAVANAWEVETAPQQVEITVMLAPAFTPDAADAQPSGSATGGWNAFKSANLIDATSATRRKYRWWIADECGDGHYSMSGASWEVQSLDLTSVFPDTDAGTKSYAVRYRPGRDRLIAVDDAGVPRKATLEVSFAGWSGDPAVQPANTPDTGWYPVTRGWELLPDRLGIRVTIEDPEQWHTGCPDPAAQVIRAISWTAKPADSASKPFMLRLTVVIEADDGIVADAPKRSASPTEFARWRQVDARDHFLRQVITQSSRFYAGNGAGGQVVRDDTDRAKSHTRQLQSAHEMPRLAGAVTIPFVTTYYQVGDRIAEIDGRNLSLQTNTGGALGESPTYPWIVGVSWSFEGERQSTTLQLSDQRAEALNSW